MIDFDESERKRKRLMRVATVVGSVIVLYLAFTMLGPFGLFAMAGVVIVLVYVFDAPELLFAGFYKARRKVQGVEHAGRHDWYGFHGSTIRVFFDERAAPPAAGDRAHSAGRQRARSVPRLPSAEFGNSVCQREYCLSASLRGRSRLAAPRGARDAAMARARRAVSCEREPA
jgi:hypothetical protein